MELVYWTSLIIGGALLLPSLLVGDIDFDADVDVDVDVDADVDADSEAGGAPAWLSVRFWTFALAFFGLTGVLLGLLDVAFVLRLGAASLMGLVSGLGVSVAVARLKAERVDSTLREGDLVGEHGPLLLPVGPGVTGKVQLRVKGRQLEVIATNDRMDLARGTWVQVYAMDPAGAAFVIPVN